MTYLQEAKRRQIKATWEGDYASFLKSCHLQMEIFVPKKEVEVARCLELVNRSNQYNISGKRYTRELLDAFLADSAVLAYGFRVRDQYGDYGIVGFVTMRKSENVLEIVDFVMSCRAMGRRIEFAALEFVEASTETPYGTVKSAWRRTGVSRPSPSSCRPPRSPRIFLR